VTTDKEHNL